MAGFDLDSTSAFGSRRIDIVARKEARFKNRSERLKVEGIATTHAHTTTRRVISPRNAHAIAADQPSTRRLRFCVLFSSFPAFFANFYPFSLHWKWQALFLNLQLDLVPITRRRIAPASATCVGPVCPHSRAKNQELLGSTSVPSHPGPSCGRVHRHRLPQLHLGTRPSPAPAPPFWRESARSSTRCFHRCAKLLLCPLMTK